MEDADDVLAALEIKKGSPAHHPPGVSQRPDLNGEEASVLDRISGEPVHIDALLDGGVCRPGRLSGLLLSLELKGLIRQLPGMYYIKEE